MKKLAVGMAAIAAGIMGLSVSAQAYETGDIILRIGAATVAPDDDSSEIEIDGIGAVGGTGVGVDNNTQLGISGAYIFAPHWGVEVLAATPFDHDISAKGLGGFGVNDIGSTKHLPPTVSVQYYFADAGAAFQPYVGLGVNYTVFFDESLSGEAKSQLGASNLDLDDSVGLAAQIGFDYRIDANWLVNVAVWKVDIDTTATLDTALGKAEVDVDIDPWVYMVGLGYKF